MFRIFLFINSIDYYKIFFLLDKSYNILMRFLIELLKRQRADGVRKPAANGRKWVGRDFKKNLLLVCKYSVIQRIYCIKSSDYVLSLLLFVLMIFLVLHRILTGQLPINISQQLQCNVISII